MATKIILPFKAFLVALVAVSLSTSLANATPINTKCQPDAAPGDYFMTLTTDSAATCLDSGFGEPSLTGNAGNDTFLNGTAGSGWSFLAKNDDGNTAGDLGIMFSQDSDQGDWSFDESLWNSYMNIAIGFKFGGGNSATSDTWFVYELTKDDHDGLFSYSAEKGLSHVNLYGKYISVPEPGILGLFALGVIGFFVARRQSKRH